LKTGHIIQQELLLCKFSFVASRIFIMILLLEQSSLDGDPGNNFGDDCYGNSKVQVHGIFALVLLLLQAVILVQI